MIQLTEQQLEDQAGSLTFKRGKVYYNDKRVECFEWTAGRFEALVEGSEEYSVAVWESRNGKAVFLCDCSYDGEKMCKHEVAVGLAIINKEYRRKSASGSAAAVGAGVEELVSK